MKLPTPKPTFAQVAAFCRIDGADYETQIALMALVAADTLQEAYELSRLPRDVFIEQIDRAATFAEPRSAYAVANETTGVWEFADPREGQTFSAVATYLDRFLHWNTRGTNINGAKDATFHLAAMALVPVPHEQEMIALIEERRLSDAEDALSSALANLRGRG